MILDVGCGTDPHGDVNIDLFSGECYEDAARVIPLKSRAPNPVIASAEWIPFRGAMFSLAVSYEVLEHVDSPVRMIREMMRCARRIMLTTPNAMFLNKVWRATVRGGYTPYKGHIQTWGEPELRNLLRHCGLSRVKISYTNPGPAYHPRQPLKLRLLELVVPQMVRYRCLIAEGASKPVSA